MPRNQRWNLLTSFLNSNVRKYALTALGRAWTCVVQNTLKCYGSQTLLIQTLNSIAAFFQGKPPPLQKG